MENRKAKPKSCVECPCYNKKKEIHCTCFPDTAKFKGCVTGEDRKNDLIMWQHCLIDWDKEDMHNLNTKGGKEQK